MRRRHLRPFLLSVFGLMIITEIVFLSPSSLEEDNVTNIAVDPETLVQDTEPALAPGIPKGRIADYSIDKFKYVSVQNGERQWRIEAERAFMYNPERLVHSRVVQAYLYDPEGKITIITGQEARYFLNKRDLEMYGKVKTIFPDGFELDSDYLRYKPNERRILIPTQYFVQGQGHESEGQVFNFTSMGLDYRMGDAKILLPKAAHVILERTVPQTPETGGVPDRTIIDSDECFIDRTKNMAHFTMQPSRPLKTRFVHITQPTLFARSRWADLNYGSFSQVLQYLIAYEDVLVKETEDPNPPPTAKAKKPSEKKSLRYATSGQAVFDTRTDVIILTKQPQVYQDLDTVTGDVVLMHRDTDVIEIEHSNAFSQGSE